MSYSNLAAINNACAAKTARERKTPYVPWNAHEVVEAGFLRRLPFLNEHQPVGWKKVGEVRSAEYFTAIGRITDAITESPVPLGFGKIEHGRYGIFEPLPEAHEGRRSER